MSFRLFSLSGPAAVLTPALFALLVLIFAAGCGRPGTAPAEEPPLAVPLADLLEENAKNPAATVKKYAGQVIETEGYLESVHSVGDETWGYLVLEKTDSHYGGGNFLRVQFRAGPATSDALARCPVKSRVRAVIRLAPEPDARLKSWGVSIRPAGE
jgi:hypothetical protein